MQQKLWDRAKSYKMCLAESRLDEGDVSDGMHGSQSVGNGLHSPADSDAEVMHHNFYPSWLTSPC